MAVRNDYSYLNAKAAGMPDQFHIERRAIDRGLARCIAGFTNP
ncbi:MAG: hypothetical protein WBW01_10475 [Terriglobales bacterium]